MVRVSIALPNIQHGVRPSHGSYVEGVQCAFSAVDMPHWRGIPTGAWEETVMNHHLGRYSRHGTGQR